MSEGALQLDPASAERVRDYYTSSVRASRLAQATLLLFCVFYIIATGSADGAKAMTKTFGSLFGSPAVDNLKQFFRLMPIAFFVYGFFVFIAHARRLWYRRIWRTWLESDANSEPSAAEVDWSADVSYAVGAPRWASKVRIVLLLVVLAAPMVVYGLGIYNVLWRERIPADGVAGMHEYRFFQWSLAILYLVGAALTAWSDWRTSKDVDQQPSNSQDVGGESPKPVDAAGGPGSVEAAPKATSKIPKTSSTRRRSAR